MERVSVIIPSYNAAEFIIDALRSVFDQDYENLEVIVVDDGSTDRTAEIVSRFSDVQLIQQSNRGAAAARNRGISAAHGEYLAFLDADDIWLPEKTKVQVNFLRNSDLKWCYCDSLFSWYGDERQVGTLSNSQGRHEGDILIPYLFGKFSIPLPATMIHRSVLDEVGQFDESMRTVEHTDLWARIAMKYPIGYIDRPLIQVRKRLDSLKQTIDPMETGLNRRRMLEKIIDSAPGQLAPLRCQLLADSLVRDAKQLLRSGRISEARECFRKAIGIRPLAANLYLFYLACSFDPLPRLFYRWRWRLLHKRKANLRPGWWSQ